MFQAGASRHQLARTLGAAYAEGLLSEKTLSHRLDELFGSRLVDPRRLIGDLTWRSGSAWHSLVMHAWAAIAQRVRLATRSSVDDEPLLLALEWGLGEDELLLGRHTDCDVVLRHPEVSRHHARLSSRDGSWMIQDLESTNGTTVNGVEVGRCELRPGDLVVVGGEHLRID